MRLRVSSSGWTCRCQAGDGRFACRVPPSPDVMTSIFMEYRRSDRYGTVSFNQYLEEIGFVDPSVGLVGMDDGAQFAPAPGGPLRLALPSQPVQGSIEVKVLLVDFPDRPGLIPKAHYEGLLFSRDTYPTGSMRDYYAEVSTGKVDVSGTVEGWFRMPQPYSYYTNGESGTKWDSYPHNAPRLAEDAVQAALAANVTFSSGLDKFGRGIITALFIVHSGRGAEVMQRPLQGAHIWSHKWQLRNPVQVAPDLAATIYLVVPHDCKVGVCAHELGHLAFEWQDFYDPNYGVDGQWSGSGRWDLMAGGSYNGDGARPAHPAALHKLKHGWITSRTVTSSQKLTIRPHTPTSGEVVKLVSPRFEPRQYLLLESRRRTGFDHDLPGEGLLVWKVDEPREMTSAKSPGMSLVQADGRNDLDRPDDWKQGDEGDPFPGAEGHNVLGDGGSTSTSFGTRRSGITLKNIKFDADGVVTLKVEFAAAGAAHAAEAAADDGAAEGTPAKQRAVQKSGRKAAPKAAPRSTRKATAKAAPGSGAKSPSEFAAKAAKGKPRRVAAVARAAPRKVNAKHHKSAGAKRSRRVT